MTSKYQQTSNVSNVLESQFRNFHKIIQGSSSHALNSLILLGWKPPKALHLPANQNRSDAQRQTVRSSAAALSQEIWRKIIDVFRLD